MKNFFLAARPKTLLAGIIPPTVTYVYFVNLYQKHEWVYFFLCFFGALLIQLATNFFNDVIDYQKGADAKRVGPTRVSAAGLVDIKTVKLWAKVCLGLAFGCGIPIFIRGGWPFLVLGLLSLYLSYGYTGGKISLAYRGLGELFVFLFFGLFSVMGSFYLYAQELPQDILIRVGALAGIFGLLTTTFICINNLRDRETDLEVGKRTLATRMPVWLYQSFILFTIFVPYLLLGVFSGYRALPIMALALIPAFKLSTISLKKKGAELNEGLKFSGIHLVVFSFFLSTVFVYGYLL